MGDESFDGLILPPVEPWPEPVNGKALFDELRAWLGRFAVLPRWVADSNFVSVVGETRVLPETLDVTWNKIKKALSS